MAKRGRFRSGDAARLERTCRRDGEAGPGLGIGHCLKANPRFCWTGPGDTSIPHFKTLRKAASNLRLAAGRPGLFKTPGGLPGPTRRRTTQDRAMASGSRSKCHNFKPDTGGIIQPRGFDATELADSYLLFDYGHITIRSAFIFASRFTG